MEHQVSVVGPASDGLLPQNGYTHHLGSTVRFLSPGDAARVNASPFVYSAVRDFLDGRRFDVFHLHEPFLPFIGPSFMRLGRGIKVGTFHTWREGAHLPYLAFWPLIIYWNRGLDGHIAVSDAARRTIGRYVSADYRVIPNGVDFERFASAAPPPSHLDDSRPTILFVGRLEARKGIPYLLRAYKELKVRQPSARLVIVGEGGLKAEYVELAHALALEDVLFEGYVKPELLSAYYQRADVFCSPSTVNESFGITLLEAMAAGAPAVATSINGTNTLGEDGVTGLIVPPKDANVLATAIERLIEDRLLAKQLADAAQERATRFDWEQIARQLLEYYEELGA